MRDSTAKKIGLLLSYRGEHDRNYRGFIDAIAQDDVRVDVVLEESNFEGACGFHVSGLELIEGLEKLIENPEREYSFVCKAHGRVLMRDRREQAFKEAAYHRESRGDKTAHVECRPLAFDFEWVRVEDDPREEVVDDT